MSDSDDTDILLLIPPDFFLIDSSDAESVSYGDNIIERTVVNDLISHVNELEDRIVQIERKDNSLSKLNDSVSSLISLPSLNWMPQEMNPATRHLGSDCSPDTSPSRRVTRFNSLPLTPSSSSRSLVPSVGTSRVWGRNYSSPSKVFSRSNRNLSPSWESPGREKPKDNELISEVDLFLEGLKRDNVGSKANKDTELIAAGLPPSPNKRHTADGVARLQLDEVDRLLKEVEAEQKNIEARLSSHDAPEVQRIVRKPGENVGSIPDLGFGVRDQWKDVDHFLQRERNQQSLSETDHFLQKERHQQPADEAIVTARKQYKLGDSVGSIPDLGFGVREAWATSSPSKQHRSVESVVDHVEKTQISPQMSVVFQSEGNPLPSQTPNVFASRRKLDLDPHAKHKAVTEDTVEGETIASLDSLPSSADHAGQVRNRRATVQTVSMGGASNEEVGPPKTLLSLAELWSDGVRPTGKSTGDTKLLQKYEEECCRRQHCEQMVQALQTKLLESQQKLAVALQVDSDKDAAIRKLQGAWNSLADHWRSVEDQRHSLTKQLQDHKLKSDSQIKLMHEKMERYETELSKALDLAHGYKEQSETAERVHGSQMEQLANKAQELERRLAAATRACSEAREREDALQTKINEDHKKLAHLQAAMDAATKSLTSHEADITVLAEEKVALQTRLKEEKARLETQQQSRDKMHTELEECKKRERNLLNELKKSSEQIHAMKAELHEFYQSQLERVVQDKLKEFQGQLDAAESALQRELESRERSVAQLAARQLQHVTEKHKLEVSLLEQKHSEELRLLQLQLTKASHQIQELETRLAAHDKRSSMLAERLHGVMENQWREALNIISCPTANNSQSDNTTRQVNKQSFGQNDKGNDSAWMLVQQQQKSRSQCSGRSSVDEAPFSRDGQVTHRSASPIQLPVPSQAEETDDLRRYIKMLLERAPGNPVVATLEQKAPSGAKTSGSGNTSLQLKPPWK